MTSKPGAVVLLSGGQDSTTTLAMAAQHHSQGLIALSINYGQRHVRELEAAKFQAHAFGAEHVIVPLTFGFVSPLIATSDLTIPDTWDSPDPAPTIIPGRNLILLALAASLAESHNLGEVWTGVAAVDYSGYPDCRPEFISGAQTAITHSTQGKVMIKTPIIAMTKADMIRKGTALGVDWANTWTCYRGGELACGHCPSCNLRLEAFAACGMTDPLEYENIPKEYTSAASGPTRLPPTVVRLTEEENTALDKELAERKPAPLPEVNLVAASISPKTP